MPLPGVGGFYIIEHICQLESNGISARSGGPLASDGDPLWNSPKFVQNLDFFRSNDLVDTTFFVFKMRNDVGLL